MTPAAEARSRIMPKHDWLSALLDDLLHRILRFVDAREAVAELSLLSRQWRHLWASSPYVNLTDSRHGDSETFGNSLLLLRNAAPLHTFRLDTLEIDDYLHQRRWVRHVLGRGLRVLEINLSCNICFDLPDDCVFNCATLEEISLYLADDVVAPKSICLPRLKKLHLHMVQLTDPSVAEKLSSGCLTLEDLTLSRCSLGLFKISSETVKTLSITGCRHKGIHVSAPNTCSLELTVTGKVQIMAMPSLLSAWVYVCPDGGKRLPQGEGGYYLVAALCNARRLELLGCGSILQDMMRNSANEGLVFSNLKSLVIGERLVADFYNTFAYFLRFAPNLASLTLDQWTLDQWKSRERRHYKNVSSQVSMEKKPSNQWKLVPRLAKDLEVLRIRLSKDEDIGEFHKMRGLLMEKIKPKEMAVAWF